MATTRTRREIVLLDRMISFDDAQETVYRVPPPLVIVASAGSGKTALTREKDEAHRRRAENSCSTELRSTRMPWC
jgi:hypothetical protein